MANMCLENPAATVRNEELIRCATTQAGDHGGSRFVYGRSKKNEGDCQSRDVGDIYYFDSVARTSASSA
jgi:hypothetical protein